LPASVTVTSARARDGRRLTFISNWSWDEIQVPAPLTAHGLTSDEPVRAGELIALGPWDVTVLVSPANDEI
jgi:beta-galactosidase